MGIYYNLMFWLILPEIFSNKITLMALIIYYIIGGIDIMIRPVPEKVKITTVEKAVAIMGLLQPFLLILSYIEYRTIIVPFIPFWSDPIIAYIGIAFLIIGGIIMIISRIQLGRYGTPVVHTGEDHILVTKGLYKLVRHPMYFGAIFMMVAPYLAFRSLILLSGIVILDSYFMNMRIKIEEETLIGAFGDEYRNYMKRTKKLIPLIY
ncbi:MAG: methyltransferase family protein [Promethearchaeota archaeon]|jgi:protein-S-isoprenylcysteine O-methyltransferase Ste14